MIKKLYIFIILFCSLSNLAAQTMDSENTHPTRTVKGRIISDKNEPIPGVTITEIGKYNKGTTSDLNGDFSLKVEYKNVVFIDLSGMHFERYLRYEIGEDSKVIVFKYKGSKKAERKSEKVYAEWKKMNQEKTMPNKR